MLIPVKDEPSIAGKAPVRLADVKLVKDEPSRAGKAPTKLAEVRDVRPEPLPVGCNAESALTPCAAVA